MLIKSIKKNINLFFLVIFFFIHHIISKKKKSFFYDDHYFRIKKAYDNMQCPECKSHETKRDCYDGVIYCTECGLVLTATHNYVGGNKINLPYGFRASLRQCETNDENDYSQRAFQNTHYNARKWKLYEYYSQNRHAR